MIDTVRADEGALSRTVRTGVQDSTATVTRFCRRKPLGAVGGFIVFVLILMAIFAPVLAPYGDTENVSARPHEPPQSKYILGTDHIGRDLFSRIIYGARISLYVGLGSVLIGITGCFLLAVVVTYVGGAVDMGFQRIVDALMALPGLLLVLAIMAVLGSSLNNVVLAIVIGMLAPTVRTVRSQVLSLKEMDYIMAARALGVPPWRIMFWHIAPNCFSTYLVLATYYLGLAIIIEASLSFLGVGAPPSAPSWGGILTRATEEHVKTGWWIGVFPGLVIFVVVLGFNFLGDALRDVFDPRLRGQESQQ